MSNEWEIERPSGKCAVTEKVLAEGESYYAVLFALPEGMQRKDYSLDAWQGPPEGCFCYWRARVPVKEKKSGPIAIDQNVLVHLFRQLEDEESEMKQQFRFVLALLLMRKRRLKLDGTLREEGKEYWKMRLTDDQSIHKVLNPELKNEQVDLLSVQLTAILSGEVEAIEALEQLAVGPQEENDTARQSDEHPEATADPDNQAADPDEADNSEFPDSVEEKATDTKQDS